MDKGAPITLERTVDTYRSGWTVVAYLAHRFKYHPVERWRRRVEDGYVRVNGAWVAPGHRLRAGDVISYTIFHDEPAVDFSYDVLYDDEDVLAVSKSGNLPVHACGVFIRNTLIATLKNRYGDHLNLVHRIDRETSGVVVLSKHREAARELSRQFARREVEKSYLAIVHGRVCEDAFQIDAPIGKTDLSVRLDHDRLYMRGVASDLTEDLPERVPRRQVDFDHGKPATTRFRVVDRLGDFTLVEAVPLSGRTNQIRVHLYHAGHSIVGDKVYRAAGLEGKALPMARQALHCARIALVHPARRDLLRIEAPVPEDFRRFTRAAGMWGGRQRDLLGS